MDKRFWSIVAVILVGFGSIVYFNSNKKADAPTSTVKASEHYRGKTDSKVTLTNYGDFQCPACYSFEPTLKAVEEKYADTVRFQFRHLPLTQIHPNAFAASRAAEAAAKQGKFWEMHDALYSQSNWPAWTQSQTPDQQFEIYARQLGLDLTKFKADSKSAAVNDIINADKAAFTKTGAPMSTPTFFVNGKLIDNQKQLLDSSGQPSVDAFSKVLDEALKSAK